MFLYTDQYGYEQSGMADWEIGIVIAYCIGCIVVFAGGLAWMIESDGDDRKTGARAALLCGLWPLAAMFFLGKGAFYLIKEAL